MLTETEAMILGWTLLAALIAFLVLLRLRGRP